MRISFPPGTKTHTQETAAAAFGLAQGVPFRFAVEPPLARF